MIRRAALASLFALMAGCASQPSGELAQCPAPAPAPTAQVCPACPVCPAPERPPAAKASLFELATFADLPGWALDDLRDTHTALRAACTRFKSQPAWQGACSGMPSTSEPALLRAYFERRFAPWRIATAEGETSGLVTGYYEPLLRGSRTRSGKFAVPLYGPPDDLLVIDLGAVNTDVRNMRLRGRLEGRRVVPYFSRSEIERGAAALSGKEIVWVDDAVEAFFLQIQGSGRVQLDGGEMLRVGYADQNGHPYVSIGRVLLDRGELQPGEATMQGIQAWARANPARLEELLNQNPSYVFFREIAVRDPNNGPLGAMGVPLTPMRSVAIDPRFIPLGAPLYLATTWPNRDEKLERLVFGQDTGGAIRGAVRADFFWGFGAAAGEQAGRMRQPGKLWLLWPAGSTPPRPQQ